MNPMWAALPAGIAAFALAAACVPLLKPLAARTGYLDRPRDHKRHAQPTPLLGGVAVLVAWAAPTLGVLALAHWWQATGAPHWLGESFAMHLPGLVERTPQAVGIAAGALVLHVLGLVDDRRALGPWLKLAVQVAVSTAVVVLLDVRVLTAAGPVLSSVLTILWLVTLINSFNFLDNMDGLSAGIAAICTAALVVAAAGVGQIFVAAWGCMLLGALLGFLVHNFPPASIFMGDAGSLVVGYLVGVLSVLTTYARPEQPHYLYGSLVPLVAMSVPLYDTVSVMLLRLRAGHRLMVGDQRHFSHRLVRRGMSRRRAVLTIYLCTAGTAIGAMVLPQVPSASVAVLIVLQTLAILGIIALLEGREKPVI